MYCPNCGNKNSTDQNFCRTCGLALEKIAQTVNEQLPTVTVKSLQERKERVERWGVASISVFGVGLFGFLFYGVFRGLMPSFGPLLAGLIVLAAAILIGCGLASVILFAKAKELNEAATKRQIGPPVESTTNELDQRLLEAHERPPLSVTDRTTDLLTPVKTTNSKAFD